MDISGQTLSSGAFQVNESLGQFRAQEIRDLLDFRLAGVFIRDALSQSTCDQLVERFWSNQGRTRRPDGVAGFYVGAYQYGKTFEEYTSEVHKTEPYVDALLSGPTDPVQLVMGAVRLAVEVRHMEVRLARWKGEAAARIRALAWTAKGPYLLAPHDDIGQLTDPLQSGFEIQECAKHQVIAVNVYPRVPKPGGKLRIWNIKPDQRTRDALDIAHTGYPYPADALRDIPYLDVDVETGSVLLSNGGLVHAVSGYDEQTNLSGERLLMNFFFGQIDQGTIVHWV